MPICERDPWRFQFFENAVCPDDLNIPTDDIDCWTWLTDHRWIYDKLRIAQSQGISCAPHGVEPITYPVFSKPIINLRGMGIGSRVIANTTEMQTASQPGHFWMELLTGPHVSTDCAIVKGVMCWLRHATGETWYDGMFQHWTIHSEIDPTLHEYLANWIGNNMSDYTGMMNFETIGNRIIEGHLRFTDQWCDLYGRNWIESLVKLYADGDWVFNDEDRKDGYSVPLFAEHGSRPFFPANSALKEISDLPHIKSLQVTFHEKLALDAHAMPPGGFRLGIINCDDLSAGKNARIAYAKLFKNMRLQIPGDHH